MPILRSQTPIKSTISQLPLKINNNIQNRSVSPVRILTPPKSLAKKTTINPSQNIKPMQPNILPPMQQVQPSRLPIQSQIHYMIPTAPSNDIKKQVITSTINGTKTTKIITTETIT